MLDLEGTMRTYNREYHANYTCILDFCQDIYNRYQSCSRVGRVLYISRSAIYNNFKKIGVVFLPKGCRGISKRLAVLLDLNTEDMTLDEIIRTTGLSKSYIKAVFIKYRMTYKPTEAQIHWNRRVPGHNMTKVELKIQGFLRSKPLFKGDKNVEKKMVPQTT